MFYYSRLTAGNRIRGEQILPKWSRALVEALTFGSAGQPSVGLPTYGWRDASDDREATAIYPERSVCLVIIVS
jgi:hypothetical protein